MASAYLLNNLDHGVRANGVRIPPGRVAEVADEETAAVLDAHPGVEKLSARDGKARVAEQLDQQRARTEESRKTEQERHLADLRKEHRRVSVVEPLQSAPPASTSEGAITTGDLADRLGGDGESEPESGEGDTSD